MEDMERFELKGVAFDRWNSDQLVIWLTGEGVEMYPHGQGFVSMSAPSKKFETMVYQSQLLHDGNPVTAWMLGNVELSTDPSGNIKPDKKRSPEKIDGIISIIMSIGLIMSTDLDLATEGPSRYEDEKGGLWVI
jgi:phage terminase large subunit-like protein